MPVLNGTRSGAVRVSFPCQHATLVINAMSEVVGYIF